METRKIYYFKYIKKVQKLTKKIHIEKLQKLKKKIHTVLNYKKRGEKEDKKAFSTSSDICSISERKSRSK